MGFVAAVFMGMVLGAIGGGGSILTVPILVYLFSIPATLATAYSLFVVGVTSLVSAIQYRHELNYKLALLFAIPSTFGVLMSRRYILQPMPASIEVFNYTILKDDLVMLVFSILILIISVFMFTAKETTKNRVKDRSLKSALIIIIEGILVGGVTGFVGAGGGFMIVPALTLLGVSIREAIATSLLIISVKSLIGFLSDIAMNIEMDFVFLLSFSLITMIGAIFGAYLNRYISKNQLRKIFAYFILIMGIFILTGYL
ncbi:MAG: sulfite exporter TauE/SafE family protein [Candidatus Margulisiibacteriota bacterium]